MLWENLYGNMLNQHHTSLVHWKPLFVLESQKLHVILRSNLHISTYHMLRRIEGSQVAKFLATYSRSHALLMSFPGWSVLAALPWLSCPGCLVLAVLFWLSFLDFLAWLYCPGCSVLAVPCSGCPVLAVLFFAVLFLAVLFWLSNSR
jgi:hypothetical protein